MSTDAEFFEHIFSRNKAGLSMITYEQDFLAKAYESCSPLQKQLGLAKAWLGAMSSAAEKINVTIQYCMALPRHILQSASFPRVTHARASHDYSQSRAEKDEQVLRNLESRSDEFDRFDFVLFYSVSSGQE